MSLLLCLGRVCVKAVITVVVLLEVHFINLVLGFYRVTIKSATFVDLRV